MKKVLHFLNKILFNSKAVIFLLVLFIASAGLAYYFYHDSKETKLLLNNPSQASEKEAEELASKVGQLMSLPSNEKPTVITVVDREKIKDQQFFAQAENDDKVLVYTESKKAILYRPSTNKIIEVGPVEMTPGVRFKVSILQGNASKTIEETEQALKDKVSNLDVTNAGSAKGTFSKLLVVDLKGDKVNEAKQLADLLSGEVSTLPASETKPTDADFLIITGK